MDDQTDLRLLVMKRAAGGGATPNLAHHSPMHSPSISYHEGSRSRGGEPLIQQVGPDFSKLSRELNRVVLKIQHQSEVASDCPMHSHESHYHVPESRRGSRAAEAQDLRRGSRAYEVVSQSQDLRRSASAETNSSHRTSTRSVNQEPSYQSLPRRLSAQPKSTRVDRRQSFQDFKTFRDKFTGKVDFKTTLRTSEDPKKTERERARKGRHYSEPREYCSPEERSGGYLIESDFDFRSPPTTRDNSRERRSKYDYDRDYYAADRAPAPRRGHVEQIYATPKKKEQIGSEGKKYQYGYHDLKSQIQAQSHYNSSDLKSPKSPSLKSPLSENELASPINIPKDPLSPRRVEFADEVFSFKTSVTPGTSRPGSRCESPNPKGILRHTSSDPNQRNVATRSNTVDLSSLEQSDKSEKSVSNVAVRSNTTDLSFCKSPISDKPRVPLTRPTTLIIPQPDNLPLTQNRNSQPLVKIMIPDEQNDSDDTLIEEKHESESSKEQSDQKSMSLRTLGEKGESKRTVPPPLADWNRSQSFPPAAKKAVSDIHDSDTNLRKTSDPIGMSTTSLLSQATTYSEFHNDLDLIRVDNEALRVRVGDLEKQVHDNNDEIKCLKATLAECLRRIDEIESKTKHQPQTDPQPRIRRRDTSEGPKSSRRPHSAASFGSQDYIGRSTFDIGPPAQRGTYAPRQR